MKITKLKALVYLLLGATINIGCDLSLSSSSSSSEYELVDTYRVHRVDRPGMRVSEGEVGILTRGSMYLVLDSNVRVQRQRTSCSGFTEDVDYKDINSSYDAEVGYYTSNVDYSGDVAVVRPNWVIFWYRDCTNPSICDLMPEFNCDRSTCSECR